MPKKKAQTKKKAKVPTMQELRDERRRMRWAEIQVQSRSAAAVESLAAAIGRLADSWVQK